MPIIDITPENLDTEHICCAITERKGETCVSDKKTWLRARMADGLVFKRLDVRGKVFIEYLPAEKAFSPIDALGYLHINCMWVSGQYKGQGYSNELLAACVQDAVAQGKHGLTVVSSSRKMPFLSDPGYLKHKGFQIADTAHPYYELLYLPFTSDAPVPKFRPQAKNGRTDEGGLVLYYTDQCPYANTYAHRLQALATWRERPMTLHKLTTAEEAQQCPSPWTTFTLFYNGQFVTNEILSEKKFEAFLDEHP